MAYHSKRTDGSRSGAGVIEESMTCQRSDEPSTMVLWLRSGNDGCQICDGSSLVASYSGLPVPKVAVDLMDRHVSDNSSLLPLVRWKFRTFLVKGDDRAT
ncbi:hypothetical protein HAX54_035316, partial [Datura stramonium]|nr:hypothetical protein [Datura stramonium]